MRKRFHLNYLQKRYYLLIFSFILLIALYLFKNASTFLRVISAIGVMFLFYGMDHIFDIRFRKRHYLIMFVIVLASFLGSPFYFVYPNYDKLQHFFQPILMCSIIFYMINKLHLELKWKIIFTFFVVVALLGIFEIGEYVLDLFFNLKLQGVFLRDIDGLEKFNLLMDPLSDTMVDLTFGILGSGIYCTIFAIVMWKRLRHNILREN